VGLLEECKSLYNVKEARIRQGPLGWKMKSKTSAALYSFTKKKKEKEQSGRFE